VDPKQFDELVARLANAATRRNAVKGLIGGALGTAGAASLAESGDTKKARKQGDRKKGGGGDRDSKKGGGGVKNEGKKSKKAKKCKAGKKKCGKKCRNLQTNASHCGRCNNVCSSGVCSSGRCVTPSG
jgi:hypothetical protein